MCQLYSKHFITEEEIRFSRLFSQHWRSLSANDTATVGQQKGCRPASDQLGLTNCSWAAFPSFNEGVPKSFIWAGWASPEKHPAPFCRSEGDQVSGCYHLTLWILPGQCTSICTHHVSPSSALTASISFSHFLPLLTQIFAHTVKPGSSRGGWALSNCWHLLISFPCTPRGALCPPSWTESWDLLSCSLVTVGDVPCFSSVLLGLLREHFHLLVCFGFPAWLSCASQIAPTE